MSSIILEAKSLTKEYKQTLALDHINLQIKKGKIYGFIGQNGAGKTTFLRLVTGLAFPTRTLNTYITAGHKRSSIFRVKLIVSQIGCIIILVFPLFVHGIISQFYIGEKLFWNDSTYTMVLLTLFAMITLCALPMFFAFIFRDMGKTLTVSMVLFFVMIFLLNSESAQIISRIIPMGQLRLISLQKVYSTNFCLFVDFLWNFILYFIAGSAFLHTDLK